MVKFFIVSGKGGSGKTTTSAAIGYHVANNMKRKVVVVSTDPAGNQDDIWGQEVSHDPVKCKSVDNLWLSQVNLDIASERLIPKLSESLEGLGIDIELTKEEKNHFNWPGLDEALAFDHILNLIESHTYDLIISDQAPTGHSLRFLSLPELLDVWLPRILGFKDKLRKLASMMGKRQPEFEELDSLQKRVSHIRKVMTDPALTNFYLTTQPEALSTWESLRARQILEEYKIPVGGIIINQIVTDENIDTCTLCAPRYEMHERYVSQIEESFSDIQIVKVPMLGGEITGVEGISRIAEIIGPKIDIKVEKTVNTRMRDGLYQVRIFYPGVRKGDVKLKPVEGNKLLIDVHGIRNEIEIPFAFQKRDILTAKVDDAGNYLIVSVRSR